MERRNTYERILLRWSLLLVALLLVPQVSFGATAPVATRLLTLSSQSFPEKIAADGNGNIYIADSVNKAVRSYTSRGAYRFSINLNARPISLAVSPSNQVFVGQQNGSNGSVDVYSTAGAYVSSITYSFDNPVAMAFKATGQLFVVDGYFLKKFDANMNLVTQYGGFQKLVNPRSVAVNDTTGEVSVLDFGATGTEAYGSASVWRVQVFDAQLNLLRNFSNYGFGQDGKVGSASSIAVDSQGRTYVSDHVQSIIMVYDSTNTSLGPVTDNTGQPIYNPLHMSIINDRLYISSTRAGSALVLGIDSYSQISVNPNSQSLSYQPGMPTSAPVTVSNTGTGTLNWNASSDAAWLSVSQASGTINGKGNQPLSVSIDPSKVTGTATGTITFTSNGGSDTSTLSVTVAGAPVLSVTPATINIKKNVGQLVSPSDLAILITNDLTPGGKPWTAAVSGGSWVSMSQTDGNGSLTPQVLIGDAAAGQYTGTITVTSEGALNSPATVTVNLQVVQTSSIGVTTNITNGSFTITGPATYSGNGKTSYTFDNPLAGTYTITFDAVTGYKTPTPQQAVLAAGGTISFTGYYASLSQAVNIIASRGPSYTQNGKVSVFRADGSQALTFNAFSTYPLGATTAVGDVDGDGTMDIIAGGGGVNVPAVIKGFHRDGTPIPGLAFTAFKSLQGVNVAAGDFDGDGKYEIIAGNRQNTKVRIFSYNNGAITDTGVVLEAYPGSQAGVIVAAADVDGDGQVELVTSQERADATPPTIHIYKIDTSGGIGNWKAVLAKSFVACGNAYATAMTTGDINGDGKPDILVVCHQATGNSRIKEFSSDGTLLRKINAGTTTINYIAAGDTNADGTAEIILGDSAVDGNKSVRIIDAASGTTLRTFDAFKSSYGVRVSVGNLGY